MSDNQTTVPGWHVWRTDKRMDYAEQGNLGQLCCLAIGKKKPAQKAG